MTQDAIRVGSVRFTPMDDLPTTRAQIAAALAAGGDYVELREGGAVVQVLVSPGTSVVIERNARAARTGEGVAPTGEGVAPTGEGVAPGGGVALWLTDDVDDWGL